AARGEVRLRHPPAARLHGRADRGAGALRDDDVGPGPAGTRRRRRHRRPGARTREGLDPAPGTHARADDGLTRPARNSCSPVAFEYAMGVRKLLVMTGLAAAFIAAA